MATIAVNCIEAMCQTGEEMNTISLGGVAVNFSMSRTADMREQVDPSPRRAGLVQRGLNHKGST
jgi:hypothetical protein